MTIQKIVPHLWFDNNAEEAIKFYTSIFKNSKILGIEKLTDAGPNMDQEVVVASFILEGQEFMAINGGPLFKFNESISFYVKCKDQAEIDYLWGKLLEGGGKEQQCGWLKDRFGLSWQISAAEMDDIMAKADAEKKRRVTRALMQMVKIDIEALRNA